MDKKNKINSEVKKRICKAVKNNKIIWDKTEKGHSNRNALKKAWERVAKEVGVNGKITVQYLRGLNFHKFFIFRAIM